MSFKMYKRDENGEVEECLADAHSVAHLQKYGWTHRVPPPKEESAPAKGAGTSGKSSGSAKVGGK